MSSWTDALSKPKEIDDPQLRLARTEQALERAEKQAIAGRFAAVVIHEINNPLEAVANLLYLLKNEPLSEAGLQYLAIMEDQLNRIGNITRQALGFNRASQQPSRSDLVELMGVAVRTFSKDIGVKQLNVKLETPEALKCIVYPGELTQAFCNLISNAIQASIQGGAIRIRIRSNAVRHRITVCDYGCGVPEDLRTTLFEAFATGRESGNGLGLWVCQRIIEKHHGQIRWRTCTKEDRHGTAFQVSLSDLSIVA
jgi:signal transduction histidine kinase